MEGVLSQRDNCVVELAASAESQKPTTETTVFGGMQSAVFPIEQLCWHTAPLSADEFKVELLDSISGCIEVSSPVERLSFGSALPEFLRSTAPPLTHSDLSHAVAVPAYWQRCRATRVF